MIPQIICYKQDASLIKKFDELGFAVLVDSVHKEKDWFLKNYENTSHSCYFIDPYLLAGTVNELIIEISGLPDFIVSFSEPVSEEQWEAIHYYWDCLLFDNEREDPKFKLADELIEKTSVLTHEQLKQDPADELVIVRDPQSNFYKFEHQHLPELDLMIVSVTKPFVLKPFTIICQQYSVKGFVDFFTDLYCDSEWGKDHADISFLKYAWKKLDQRGDLDMDSLLKQRTSEFLPTEGIVKAEPIVYRMSIDDLLKNYRKGEKILIN